MSLNISDGDNPSEWHNRVKSSNTTSGTIVASLAVALPIVDGSPVERDINDWASASVESMLLRIRQGLAAEYMRRALALAPLRRIT